MGNATQKSLFENKFKSLKLGNKLKVCKIEREVEDVYNQGLSFYFADTEIKHPFACDGFINTTLKPSNKILKLIIEYKFNDDMKQKVIIAKLLVQVIFYLKRFEQAGNELPNVVMVGDINECFVMHVNDLLKYLDYNVDWSVAPSEAYKRCPDMIADLTNDESINPFVFWIDENFDFKSVIERIYDLCENVKRYVRVTEHNISSIFEYFRDRVIFNKNNLTANELVHVFVGLITNSDEFFLHPKKKNLIVTPNRNIACNGDAFHSFFEQYTREYTPQERMNFTAIADRLLEDTTRRRQGCFNTPTKFVDFSHRMIEKELGENWRDDYVVYDCCCYDEQTEVFTKQGWKFFKDLLNTDEIYSLNPFNETAEWSGFEARQIIPFKGDMLHFESNMVDLLVTPDHKMYNTSINRDYKRSQKPRMSFFWDANDTYYHLERGNTIYQTLSSKLKTLDEGTSTDFIKGQFIGFYLGDGSTSNYKDKPYAVQFSLSKERKLTYLRQIISKLGLVYTETPIYRHDNDKRQDAVLFTIKLKENNLQFMDSALSKKASEKCIPCDIKNTWNYMLFQGIIDGMTNSDGHVGEHKRDNTHVRITTTSKCLAEDLCDLCTFCGVTNKLFLRSRLDKHHTEYTVTLFHGITHTALSKRHITKFHYDGMVYDVTLNKNHVLLIKRNGKVCFSGNCGTGNLTRDYRFKELYCSTLDKGELELGSRYNPEATKWQMDFLNDGDECFDKGLIQVFEQNKPIVFFINPPYGKNTGDSRFSGLQTKVTDTKVHDIMHEEKYGGSENLQHQFMFRITKLVEKYNLTNAYFVLFSNPIWLSGAKQCSFLKKFTSQWECKDAYLFQASHFADVSDTWGISLTLWKANNRANPMNEYNMKLIDILDDGSIDVVGHHTLYNSNGNMQANEWCRTPLKGKKTMLGLPMTSGLGLNENCKFHRGKKTEDAIGFMFNGSNNVGKNATEVSLLSETFAVGQGFCIIEQNFTRCTELFTSRKLIECTWINAKDEYLAPNESHPDYKRFEADSIIYSLFHNSSNQTSMRQVTYKGKNYDIPNEFFWMSKETMMNLANENHDDFMFNDARTSKERYVFTLLQDNEITQHLSETAKQLLSMATEMTIKSMKYRTLFESDHPDYHIHTWDAGYYQLKNLWKEYLPDDFKQFRELFKKFGNELKPLVYEVGFLRK